jgi:acyl-CoA hydrolase
MPVAPPWLDSIERGVAVMGGPSLRNVIESGRLSYLPVRYSALGRLLEHSYRPQVAVIAGRPAPGGFKFGLEVGYGQMATKLAAHVIVEVDPTLPDVPGAPVVASTGSDVMETELPAPEWGAPPPTAVDAEIGKLMASLVLRHATVQYGPGSIGDSAIRALEVPVRIHSGLITDAVADLAEAGRLEGQATTAYLVGGRRLRSLAEGGGVRLVGVEETHSPARLAAIDGLFALNTALEVGLDGSVNVEMAGGKQIGGVGGHPDFCAAASCSPQGLAVIGIRSSHEGRSGIVPVAHPTTTPRASVDVVVSEHGIADLRRLGDGGRADALIRIADPAFRDELRRAL